MNITVNKSLQEYLFRINSPKWDCILTTLKKKFLEVETLGHQAFDMYCPTALQKSFINVYISV